MSSSGYVIRRFLQIPLVLLIISVMVFGLIYLTPGDPVELSLPAGASAELADAIRKQLGLDQPVHVQYVRWVWKLLHADLGKSIQTREPVRKMISERRLNAGKLGEQYAIEREELTRYLQIR